MKKKNLKSLKLNKKLISHLKGGQGDPPPIGIGTHSCNNCDDGISTDCNDNNSSIGFLTIGCDCPLSCI